MVPIDDWARGACSKSKRSFRSHCLLPPPPVSGQRGASLGHGERQQLQERASSIVHLSTEKPAAAESEATQQQHAPPEEDGGFWEGVSQDAEKKQKRWFWF